MVVSITDTHTASGIEGENACSEKGPGGVLELTPVRTLTRALNRAQL